MKRFQYIQIFAGALILLFSGCDGFSGVTPESTDAQLLSSGAAPSMVIGAGVPVNNYLVHFDGRTYIAGVNQTQFAYTVSGTGEGAPLTRFGIELPDCAPELDSFSPVDGVNIDDSARIEWNREIGIGGSASYVITFPGNVPAGIVRVGVISGGVDGVALAAGPCGGATTFDISGTVFTDTNQDGALESEETGISNVTVHLLSGLGLVAVSTTGPNGAYVFEGQIAGDYTIMIPSTTIAEDFNEELFNNFTYIGASPDASIEVTIGPGSAQNNFPFDPNIEALIEAFEAGDISTTGETVRFWKEQLLGAMGEVSHNGVEAEIDAVTMQGYLNTIEVFLLTSPYQFNDADEFQAAFDILRTDSRDDIDQLLKELLAAELNHVSGRGIANVDGLQEALLGWGEALVLDNTATVTALKAGDNTAQTLNNPVSLGQAAEIFRAINGGGSGGGGNE